MANSKDSREKEFPVFTEHECFFLEPIVEQPLNDQMVKAMSQAAGSRRCWCYPSGSEKAMDIWLPNRGGTYSAVDLFLANLFPNGLYSLRIARLPGTNILLPTAWRIYFDTGRYMAPMNQCIWDLFKIKWHGNVILVKHRRGAATLVQVRPNEDEYADMLLALWLKQFLHVRDNLDVRV
ncbi:hypothetical protein C8R46DRAFT_1024898 [Mycena filopes]|nr:hypothetical protein C8R46DRAFT_1024898 [Mycena filopes]